MKPAAMGARTAFAFSQIFVLALIAGAIYFYFKRKGSPGNGISDTDLAAARSRISELMKNDGSSRGSSDPWQGGKGRGTGSAAPALTAALPSWTSTTPAHVILGVPAGSSPQMVEMAYRALVKKYHPDRFSSWGSEYMDRAHEITILLQKARDTLLKASA